MENKISNGVKLLIVTQKVDYNDDLLGFFHQWIKEFASHFEKVSVICLGKGEYDLPDNVLVYSLGKEKKISKFIQLFNFYKYIWQLQNDYDAVFVHMNPEHIVSGGLVWKLLHKKIALWYTHRLVDLKLRISEKLATIIFTASPAGFGLKSEKVKVVGHGIDTEEFKPTDKIKGEVFQIIYVGRISKIKNQQMLIEAAKILKEKNLEFKIKLIGQTITSGDGEYLSDLKRMIGNYHLGERIEFVGSVPYQKIKSFYQSADLNVNLCPTGGLDKAVLEAMASGIPVMAANNEFKKEFGVYADKLMIKENDAADLAQKIESLNKMNGEENKSMKAYLRDRVIENHELKNLINKISDEIKRLV